jgi:hypothetical protein
MITNTGKQILAKYLIGQTPSYASHIAIGCGAKPFQTTDVLSSTEIDAQYNKTSLDFEMFRVPIISRGYVTLDDGTPNVVFTAELPTAERYEITEVGIYPAASNSAAVNTDSRTLYAFSTTEQWQHHTESAASAVPTITAKLDPADDDIIDLGIYNDPSVFQTNADNKTFTSLGRIERYENCRFYNNIIAIRGDDGGLGRVSIIGATVNTGDNTVTFKTSKTHDLAIGDSIVIYGFTTAGFNILPSANKLVSAATLDTFTVPMTITGLTDQAITSPSTVYGYAVATNDFFINSSSSHIHLTGASLSLDNNENDELRMAFSIVNRDGSPATVSNPDEVRVFIEFKSTEGDVSQDALQYANFEISLTNGGSYNDTETVNFASNRYFVIKKKLDELIKSNGFTWNTVDVVKISATAYVLDSGILKPSSDYYICMDAMRLENISTKNPLYGLTGYSVIRTQNAETVVKAANTTNYVEFRFGFGVDTYSGAIA